MSLLRRKLLILDCQTTGTSPARDHLLELGWAWVEPGEENPEPESALLRVPAPFPRKVTEITGITPEDSARGMEAAEAHAKFHDSLRSAGPERTEKVLSVAHYAQFERGFLEKFFQDQSTASPIDLLCTYRIAQRLFPEAPSRNIRGLAGYLGCELPELRRAADHVRATALIWSRIEKELHQRGILTRHDLDAWLAEKPKKSSSPKEKVKTAFHLSREKRLALPKAPGIYRMLSKTGEVLYVGKATSLHSRVNSYFRGGVSRDPRKLELLARVYDIEVQECASPLEAALLENEEIKARAPRYNRALRPSTRALAFFDRAFREVSAVQDDAHPIGPFREGSAVLELFGFLRGLEEGLLVDVFFDLVTEEALKEGFALFLAKENLEDQKVPELRKLIAIGMRELRAYLKLKRMAGELEAQLQGAEPDADADSGSVAEATDPTVTPEEVAEKFTGLCARGAEELRRAKRLGRLLNAEIAYEAKPEEWHSLRVAGGKVAPTSQSVSSSAGAHPWAGLKIDDYDRMSVLLAELHRFPHRVEPLNPVAKENGAP